MYFEQSLMNMTISGTSNLADQPISGAFLEDRIFSDKEDIFKYEKFRESKTKYAQRTTDISVTETGLKLAVKTTIIMAPEIHGTGSGWFNTHYIQVPVVIRYDLKHGQAAYIGNGMGVWDHVHISNVSNLFKLCISKILRREEVPTGEKGIIFSSAGRFTWKQFAEFASDALFKRGAISIEDAKSITLEEARDWGGWGYPFFLNWGTLQSKSNCEYE
ncbi:hypothetical protein NHQ30_002929 [Ciborinia camelliae]|nr:hypothetical protein NHQ30_002929 [Ciborinia camelliae]